MIFRDANPGDALDITEIQVSCWKEAYKTIFPNEYLHKISYKQKARVNERLLRNLEETTRVFVAEIAQKQEIDFSMCGLERENHPLYKGELWGIYVSSDYQRKGIGTALVKKVIQHLLNINISSMVVWVLKQNPYRSFYDKLKGSLLEEREKNFQGLTRTMVSYGWLDIKNIFDEI